MSGTPLRNSSLIVATAVARDVLSLCQKVLKYAKAYRSGLTFGMISLSDRARFISVQLNYIMSEYIGTGGLFSKSASLRRVIKQDSQPERDTVLPLL